MSSSALRPVIDGVWHLTELTRFPPAGQEVRLLCGVVWVVVHNGPNPDVMTCCWNCDLEYRRRHGLTVLPSHPAVAGPRSRTGDVSASLGRTVSRPASIPRKATDMPENERDPVPPDVAEAALDRARTLGRRLDEMVVHAGRACGDAAGFAWYLRGIAYVLQFAARDTLASADAIHPADGPAASS